MGVKNNYTKSRLEIPAARNEYCKWWTSVSRTIKNGHKLPFFAPNGPRTWNLLKMATTHAAEPLWAPSNSTI